MRHQRGQVLVIFAGGLLAVMAIAALVIDIGLVFMIHRHEQNAADPGALAAARYIRYPGPTADTTKMFQAACFYARQNSYFRLASDNSNSSTGCVSANDDSGASLAIHFPPSTAAGEYAGRPGFVEVVLTETHQSFFAGLIGMSRIPVSSAAVAAFNLGDSNSNSLVALKTGACSTLTVTGSGAVNIQPVTLGMAGGYVMVDSACAPASDGTPNLCGGGPGGLDIGGGGAVSAPAMYVVGSCFKHGTGPPAPPVTEGAPYYADPLASLVGPPQTSPGAICPTLSRADKHMVPGDPGCTFNTVGPYTLQPGVYYGGIKTSSTKPILNLTPGIYIMAGGGFTGGGGDIESAAGDILIYSTDVALYYGTNCVASATAAGKVAADYCQGNIIVNAQTALDIQGLNLDPCPPISSTGCPYVGMLFWQDGKASAASTAAGPIIRINGGASLNISGTVYNPAGETDLNGNSKSNTGCTVSSAMSCASVQIISSTIKIDGGAGLNMPYNPNKLYHLDNQGLVH